MKKYVKKPIEIEALQWTGTNHREMFDFLENKPDQHMTAFGDNFRIDHGKVEGGLVIKTLEGEHIASIGDFIIKGVKGEFYPCKPDVFELTYQDTSHPTSLPSDAITSEEFIREKIREDLEVTGEMKALCKYLVNGENCLKWAHEYATARIAEVESEMKADLRNKLSPFTNLIAMIESSDYMYHHETEIHRIIEKEIKQCKINVTILTTP